MGPDGAGLCFQRLLLQIFLFFFCLEQGRKIETSKVVQEVGTRTRKQLLQSTKQHPAKKGNVFVSRLAFNTSYHQLTFQNEKAFSAEKAGGLNLKASEFDFLIISALFFCKCGRIH